MRVSPVRSADLHPVSAIAARVPQCGMERVNLRHLCVGALTGLQWQRHQKLTSGLIYSRKSNATVRVVGISRGFSPVRPWVPDGKPDYGTDFVLSGPCALTAYPPERG